MASGWATLQFDNRTATEIGALAAFSVSVLSALLWRTRRTYPGFGRWVLGNCGACLSLAALAVRGLVPDWVSVVVTNGGAFIGAALLLEGSREFVRVRAACPPARILAGLGILAQVYFVVSANDIGVRILVASLCIGLLTTASAVTLFRGMPPSRRLGFIFTGSLFLINALFNFGRGTATWLAWPAPDLFASTLVNQLYFGGMAITIIGWGFGFILLTNDRLVEDLTAAEQRTAELNQELRRANEQATVAAGRAEHADQAKSDFLAYMSHEIRNPLSGVLVLSELILDGPLTEEKRRDLETLHQSAKSVQGILDDLLDLSKIEAGRMEVTVAPFDLELELAQIADLFSPQAGAKSTVLRLTFPPEVPRWFHGDGPRIRQIVSNFASNAVKFTDHGEIEICVERINGSVRVSVRDTGIGITTQALSLLFSRFTQADPGVSRRGTGLGLAISKHLAELMGGSVGAASEEGRGSNFWVELPLKPAEHEDQPERRISESNTLDLAGLRVLLAEDNTLTRFALAKLLERHGVAVDAVPNGREAVALYGHVNYAAVLMDCQMPEMDGYEAARMIREVEKGLERRTPVIAITALTMAGECLRCQAAGMDDYLVKPIAPAALFECIAAHLVGKAESTQDGASA
jgi:signal transduction histidine kinase/CheY-like chemotaxis protein